MATTLEQIAELEASLTAARTNGSRARIADLTARIAELWRLRRKELASAEWSAERRTAPWRHPQ